MKNYKKYRVYRANLPTTAINLPNTLQISKLSKNKT